MLQSSHLVIPHKVDLFLLILFSLIISLNLISLQEIHKSHLKMILLIKIQWDQVSKLLKYQAKIDEHFENDKNILQRFLKQ